MRLHHSFYDTYAQYLFDHFESYNGCVFNQEPTKHFQTLCEFAEIKDGLEVLDAGCGNGQFLNFIANNFKNISATGIDASRQQISIARNASVGPLYFKKDFHHFSGGPFDRIFFNESIGYAQDDQYALIRKYHKMLKPRGTLIISTFQKHRALEGLNFDAIGKDYKSFYRARGLGFRALISVAGIFEYKSLDFNFIKNNFKFDMCEKPRQVQKKWLTKHPATDYTVFSEAGILASYIIFKIDDQKKENQKTNSRCGTKTLGCPQIQQENILGKRDDDIEKTDAEI